MVVRLLKSFPCHIRNSIRFEENFKTQRSHTHQSINQSKTKTVFFLLSSPFPFPFPLVVSSSPPTSWTCSTPSFWRSSCPALAWAPFSSSTCVFYGTPPLTAPIPSYRPSRFPTPASPLNSSKSYPQSPVKTFSWAPNAPSASTTSPPTNPLDWFPVATTRSTWNAPTPGSPSTLSVPYAEPNSTSRFSLPQKIPVELYTTTGTFTAQRKPKLFHKSLFLLPQLDSNSLPLYSFSFLPCPTK